jgi:hypothetical protein
MIKLKKIQLKKFGSFLKKLPRLLGEKAFLTFLGLLILSLILGTFVFYKYSFLIKKIEPQIIERPLKFQEKTYEDVLKSWQEKEERFKKADFKEYPDPFR